MTRRATYASVLASVAAWALGPTLVWPSSAVLEAQPADLSALKFAPSVPDAGAALVPSEPDPPRRSSARAAQLMLELAAEIAEEQQREGQFSPGLRAYLVSLASLYQELGDHVAAIAALEKTRQIIRVNDGLSSLHQAEIALLEITSLEAIGRRDLAALERSSLVELARRHPTDLRVGAIYAAVADARVAAVERWLADKSEPPVIFGSGPRGADDNVQSTHQLVRVGLTAAQLNYVDALRATAINGSSGGRDVYELESALMRTFYIQAQTPKIFFGQDVTPYQVRKMLDEVGSSSYERRVKYGTLLGRPASETASYLIELGDWHLLFREDAAGAAAYREARDVLIGAGVPDEEIDALFTPSMPLLVPVFAPQLIDSSAASEYDGHLDVAIDLNDYGRSESVRVTAHSGPAASKATMASITARLEKHIAKSQFRPRFVHGERTDAQLVALRYYFKY
jgi:hypothetical protein